MPLCGRWRTPLDGLLGFTRGLDVVGRPQGKYNFKFDDLECFSLGNLLKLTGAKESLGKGAVENWEKRGLQNGFFCWDTRG